MGRYRSRLQIIADVLSAAGEGAKKTHIMYGANLSYKLVTRYLDEVVKVGLLEFDGESLYAVTSVGEEFLQHYEAYENDRKELESHLNNVKNGRDILENMLSA